MFKNLRVLFAALSLALLSSVAPAYAQQWGAISYDYRGPVKSVWANATKGEARDFVIAQCRESSPHPESCKVVTVQGTSWAAVAFFKNKKGARTIAVTAETGPQVISKVYVAQLKDNKFQKDDCRALFFVTGTFDWQRYMQK